MKGNSFALALFVLAFAGATTRAQDSWTNRFNGSGNNRDQAWAIAVDGNGNAFVTGSSDRNATGYNGYDYATIKYSPDGLSLWTNNYNGAGDGEDAPRAIAVDHNGDVLVTGQAFGDGSSVDYATIKYSNNGTPMWTNCYNGIVSGYDQANAIAVDVLGSVYVTGYSQASGSDGECLTIKYSSLGMPLWTNRYGGGYGDDVGRAIAVNSSNDVFVAGFSVGDGSGWDYATIKYSSDGVPLWTNRYNGPASSEDYASALAVDVGGNVIVTGFSYNGLSYDYATIKYSSGGLPLWTNCYNGSGNGTDLARAIVADGSGNAFVTGASYANGYSGYLTIKYSNDGVSLWTNRFDSPGTGAGEARAIVIDGSSNVIVTGGAAGYATIKYSNSGVPLWTNRYNGLENGLGEARAIALTGNGDVFVTGYMTGGASDFDYVTIKYAAVSLPQIAVLENPRASAGEFSFDLVAEPGGQFAIQVSTNLADWETVRQVTIPVGGNTNILETFASGAGQMFYRAQRE